MWELVRPLVDDDQRSKGELFRRIGDVESFRWVCTDCGRVSFVGGSLAVVVGTFWTHWDREHGTGDG